MDGAAATKRLLGKAIIEQSPRQESPISSPLSDGGNLHGERRRGYFTAAAVISLVCGPFAELPLTRFCPFPAGSGDNHPHAAPRTPQQQKHRHTSAIDISVPVLGSAGAGGGEGNASLSANRDAGGPRGQQHLTLAFKSRRGDRRIVPATADVQEYLSSVKILGNGNEILLSAIDPTEV